MLLQWKQFIVRRNTITDLKIRHIKFDTVYFYQLCLKNHKIICNNFSLERICKELERLYAINIKFLESDQKETLISGTLHLEPNNLESVLRSISLLSKRQFKLQGEFYILL